MAGLAYPLQPQEAPKVSTEWRTIRTPLPHPDSLPLLEQLRRHEPRSMQGQPPIVWHRAHKFTVEDPYGNRWIDFSSGVLVTNAGHGRARVREAMEAEMNKGLHHAYCFPHQARADLVEKLTSIAPSYLNKIFLLTTGAEAVECTIKLARKYGTALGGGKKKRIVSFHNAFHGRTLGAQLAGGIPALKAWIHQDDPTFVQVPFPDGYSIEDVRFEAFLEALEKQVVYPEEVAGVMLETYQGATGSFAPIEFMKRLRGWCDKHRIALILDEVQAAFGRCGRWFGFEHYGIEPDLICCGKGITSGMPLSAVIGREHLMDQFNPGEMTSTHSGNPLCCRAALASIEVIETEDLVENADQLSPLFDERLNALQRECPTLGAAHGRGLVRGVRFVHRGAKTSNGELAHRITWRLVQNGVLVFAPVGPGGGTIKLTPPLCITEEAFEEGLEVFAAIAKEESLAAV